MEQLQNYIDAIVRTDWVTTAISAVVILAITAVVARLTRRFLGRVLAINEERDLPSSSIFINIARGAVWITGVCIMLSTCFRVDVSAAITALGIGGIAISLGFQDTLSNLIGGLQVSLLRIIKPGDNIEVGSSTGVVKDITWRHTTIRNGAGEEVLIPNSIISKTALTHLPPTNQVSLAIVVTTEGQHLDEVAEAIEAGAHDFGENRPDSLEGKCARFPQQTWHFIGNIQSRRIPDIVRDAALVHSLYQQRHVPKFDAAAAASGKVQDVLLEVNVSGEASKSGLAPSEVAGMLEYCAGFPHVRVRGLMTMAPQGDAQRARACFADLARLRDEVRLGLDGEQAAVFDELSMGMSEDWHEAIAEGATIVRIGRALFDDAFEGPAHA